MKRKTRIRIGPVNRDIDNLTLLVDRYLLKGLPPIILDTGLHFVVERLAEKDPVESVEKFLRFNGGPLLRECLKLCRARKRRAR
jgi:hypothetical protein